MAVPTLSSQPFLEYSLFSSSAHTEPLCSGSQRKQTGNTFYSPEEKDVTFCIFLLPHRLRLFYLCGFPIPPHSSSRCLVVVLKADARNEIGRKMFFAFCLQSQVFKIVSQVLPVGTITLSLWTIFALQTSVASRQTQHFPSSRRSHLFSWPSKIVPINIKGTIKLPEFSNLPGAFP